MAGGYADVDGGDRPVQHLCILFCGNLWVRLVSPGGRLSSPRLKLFLHIDRHVAFHAARGSRVAVLGDQKATVELLAAVTGFKLVRCEFSLSCFVTGVRCSAEWPWNGGLALGTWPLLNRCHRME